MPRNTGQVKLVIASFRCYDNSDAVATLIITNFHLYLTQLWWQFFQNFVLWRRSLCSNLGGIGPEKLYRATLRAAPRKYQLDEEIVKK